ncbi:DNA recombination protein RmuC [Hydrocarboniclastica marina]|nr:DNA recombination protein RmuC [Hydrocarboniclastica marina]
MDQPMYNDPQFWMHVGGAALVAILLMLALLLPGLRRSQRLLAEQSQDLQWSEQQQQALQQQIDRLESDVESLDSGRERWRQDAEHKAAMLARLEAERDEREKRHSELTQELAALRRDLATAEQALHQRELRQSELQVTLDAERETTREKLTLLERNRDALKQEFELLANRIFEQKSEKFSEQNRSNLQELLVPFRDQLSDFRKRVDDVHNSETRDRQALRSEIDSLKDLNRQITEEAASLTKALRGDKKIQGNWGELILEKVLERSGLRKGTEYDTQASYRDEDHQLWRPDVVVHLPDQRNVIVDAKVSLVAYQGYVTAEDEEGRLRSLRDHVDAVRKHIRDLSAKDYSQLKGINSPDFVLLFMPIEPAFIAAFQHDENLFAEAFDQKVVIVTPTTLLATLRTIENIWRYERQSQNARKVAEKAGAVYDKLRVFLEHMERLGDQINTLHGTYDRAMTTLNHGKGNLISQAHQFKSLGVRIKKELPRKLLDQAELEASDDSDPPVEDSWAGDADEASQSALPEQS